MKIPNKLVLLVVSVAFIACGCAKEETPGDKLDNALDKAGDTLKDAGEKIKTD